MILVDTNVLSEGLKPNPAPQVVEWLDQHFHECATSTITLFELWVGVGSLPEGRRRDALEAGLERIEQRFGARVYSFDLLAARAAATLRGRAREVGLGLHQVSNKLADLQIAGIAAAYGPGLATRNRGDFAGLGIELVDPWRTS